tara:strand:- start:116925 stop:118097 length:1173 start_codon:yes stop_codon:yes gene_type:complete
VRGDVEAVTEASSGSVPKVIKPVVAAGYKETDVGVIPNDWTSCRIDKHAIIKTGSRNTQDRVNDGAYPFFVRSQRVEKINSYSYDGEAVLTAGDGVGTGKVFHYINGKFDVHQRVYRISEFSKDLDGRYFYYQFSTRFYERIMSMTAKSSVDSVRMEMIAGMNIALPSAEEQRAIATALSDVDALLEELDRLIAKKRDIKQATMQQLLTGQTRLPGFEEDWTDCSVGEILSVRHGRDQKAIQAADGLNPIYASGGEIGRTNTSLYDGPSVLIGRKGTIDKPRYVDKPFWTVDTLFYTELLGQNSARYMFYKFCMIPWRQYNEASGVPSLSAKTIERIEIRIPQPEEQQAIAAVISEFDNEIDNLEQRRKKTAAIKQAMMQELLTGRTRLV